MKGGIAAYLVAVAAIVETLGRPDGDVTPWDEVFFPFERGLTERFDEDWWRNPRTAQEIRSVLARGVVLTGDAPKLVVECSSISLEGSAELRALLAASRDTA